MGDGQGAQGPREYGALDKQGSQRAAVGGQIRLLDGLAGTKGIIHSMMITNTTTDPFYRYGPWTFSRNSMLRIVLSTYSSFVLNISYAYTDGHRVPELTRTPDIKQGVG